MASEMQRIEVEITEVKRKMLNFAGKVIFDAPVLLSNFFAMQGFMFHLALLFFILSCSFLLCRTVVSHHSLHYPFVR